MALDPEKLKARLVAAKMFPAGPWRATLLAGDGSDRLFLRLVNEERGERCLAILPANDSAEKLAEARAAFHIGRHLFGKGVPVPEIHDYDPATGIMICEDLGDTLLHEVVRQQLDGMGGDHELVRCLYRRVLEVLVTLQVDGVQGFEPGWCWQTPVYDQALMLERESGYFLSACCQDFLGLADPGQPLAREFELLAARAGGQPAIFFLHRDFQCRNLMLQDGKVRVIDFQGGRLGPLGYDLASLLIDPYAGLDAGLQEELVGDYMALLDRRGLLTDSFREGYFSLAAQRNLQILGAFAFLSKQRGKPFFRRFLLPAANSLHEHLAKPAGDDYPCLRRLVHACLHRLHELQA